MGKEGTRDGVGPSYAERLGIRAKGRKIVRGVPPAIAGGQQVVSGAGTIRAGMAHEIVSGHTGSDGYGRPRTKRRTAAGV